MRLSDRLGGHLVSGHVDERGTLLRREQRGDNLGLVFSAGEKMLPYLVEKGCVAIEGVSLTVNSVGDGTFEVNAVPHTLRHTLLGDLEVGDPVNVEADLIGKYVERMLSLQGLRTTTTGVDLDFLRRHGFA